MNKKEPVIDIDELDENANWILSPEKRKELIERIWDEGNK
jgi:hypothetical protein